MLYVNVDFPQDQTDRKHELKQDSVTDTNIYPSSDVLKDCWECRVGVVVVGERETRLAIQKMSISIQLSSLQL